MSAAALMQSAQGMGIYTADHARQAEFFGYRLAELGYKDDYKSPMIFNWKNTPHNQYIHQLKFETGNLMATRGKSERYRASRKGGYGQLDKAMSIDTLGTTTSIWNKRQTNLYSVYNQTDRDRRRQDMARLQRYQLRDMWSSPINHMRM